MKGDIADVVLPKDVQEYIDRFGEWLDGRVAKKGFREAWDLEEFCDAVAYQTLQHIDAAQKRDLK